MIVLLTFALKKTSETPVIVEEKLDGLDIDDMETYWICLHLSSLMGIWCSSYGNSKVVVNDGELTRNINQKKKSDVLQGYRCSLCQKCSRRGYLFNKHVEYCESVRYAWFLLWLDFPCGWVINNWKGRKIFSDQMYRDCLDLILVRCDRNCSTFKNLRCLNSTVNDTYNSAVQSSNKVFFFFKKKKKVKTQSETHNSITIFMQMLKRRLRLSS